MRRPAPPWRRAFFWRVRLPTRALTIIPGESHPDTVHPAFRSACRAAVLFVALALVAALTVHACHAHDGALSSHFHATCVACSLGAPTAVQAVAICTHAEAAPLCFLSIEDRDHAMPPARADVDLSRAPPVSLVS